MPLLDTPWLIVDFQEIAIKTATEMLYPVPPIIDGDSAGLLVDVVADCSSMIALEGGISQVSSIISAVSLAHARLSKSATELDRMDKYKLLL